MNIIVCVKRVPMTQEVDLAIDASKKDVKRDMLAYVLNEWDNYAIEEAILLKEKFGGTVTAVTLGGEDDEEVLRRCLAMGADEAVRIDPQVECLTVSSHLASWPRLSKEWNTILSFRVSSPTTGTTAW